MKIQLGVEISEEERLSWLQLCGIYNKDSSQVIGDIIKLALIYAKNAGTLAPKPGDQFNFEFP